MSVPGVEQVAVVVAREQADVVRREVTARAREAGPGIAMVGGGGLLVALASGTGTAAFILLLGRRPGAAAALGVTGAYAGAGAFLARKGLVRLREAAPSMPDVPVPDEAVQDAKQELGSAKRRTTSAAAKSPRRAKSAAKSATNSSPQSTGRPKPKS
jgi:Putative Actinobacterial Holin-X, holin superfamily III